jgi:hypothetical protein
VNTQLERVAELLRDWHEYGRQFWRHDGLDYDQQEPKSARGRRKYVLLDCGTSGAFALDKGTGEIFCIKAYGVPNKKKLIGTLGTVTGEDLYRRRWS